LVPDLAVYEVVNALYVQQDVLHIIDDGLPYIDALYDIVGADVLHVVASSRDLLRDAYSLAARYGGGTYDCLFVALALRADLELRTHDRRQARIFEEEKMRLERDSGARDSGGGLH